MPAVAPVHDASALAPVHDALASALVRGELASAPALVFSKEEQKQDLIEYLVQKELDHA